MNTLRILLADDHAVVRAGLRKVLEELPREIEVIEVENGPQVFEALKEHDFDIMLIDVAMPSFDPIPAIQTIRADYPHMKILVVSAYDDDIYVQGLLAAGVHGYHLKDQPLSDLKLAVERVLAGDKWVSGTLLDKLIEKTHPMTAMLRLSERQRELLVYLQKGWDNRSIAREMKVSVKTVENHLTRLYRQLGVQSRLEAVNFVYQHPEVLGVQAYEVLSLAERGIKEEHNAFSIMVVDDNARYRMQLQRIIGKVYPHALLLEAEDTQTAVAIAKQLNPKLIFVDVVLGEEDGICCTQRIKAVSRDSRIILISAYPDREFHRRGLESGAIAFLDKKDLDAATLRQVIEDVMG